MASKRKGRILAFQALYFWEANKVPVDELIRFAWLEEKKLANLGDDIAAFSRILTAGTIENIDEIDKVIKSHLEHWDFTRLNRVDLAILRISTYALMYQKEMHSTIVINEAIGISREYGTDDSFKFINGVLDNIRKTISSREKQ